MVLALSLVCGLYCLVVVVVVVVVWQLGSRCQHWSRIS